MPKSKTSLERACTRRKKTRGGWIPVTSKSASNRTRTRKSVSKPQKLRDRKRK